MRGGVSLRVGWCQRSGDRRGWRAVGVAMGIRTGETDFMGTFMDFFCVVCNVMPSCLPINPLVKIYIIAFGVGFPFFSGNMIYERMC